MALQTETITSAIETKPGFVSPENLNVRIELAFTCNLHCLMCDFSLPKAVIEKRAGGPQTFVPDWIFDHFCNDVLPSARECIIGIRGEPMMHPQFNNLLRRIACANVPDIQMHTNGTLLTKPSIKLICELGVKGLIVSVDGMQKSTYEFIRPGANFDKVMRNIQLFTDVRGNQPFPILQWNFVMMRRNLRELPGLVDLAADMKVDVIHAFHVIAHQALNLSHQSCFRCPEETNAVMAMARERAIARGVTLHLPPMIRLSHESRADAKNPRLPHVPRLDGPICGYPWREIITTQNGDVFPCVFWYLDPPLGNLGRASFHDIWNGHGFRALRTANTYHISNYSCNHCPVAVMKLGRSEQAFLNLI